MARAQAEAILNRPFKKKHKRSTHMLASIFSLNVLQTALELGCIYALVALALILS